MDWTTRISGILVLVEGLQRDTKKHQIFCVNVDQWSRKTLNFGKFAYSHFNLRKKDVKHFRIMYVILVPWQGNETLHQLLMLWVCVTLNPASEACVKFTPQLSPQYYVQVVQVWSRSQQLYISSYRPLTPQLKGTAYRRERAGHIHQFSIWPVMNWRGQQRIDR